MLEHVPDIAELLPNILGSDVCIFEAALAVQPAVRLHISVDDASWPQRVSLIACTGVNAALRAGNETSGVRIERPDVCCSVDVSQLIVGKQSQIDARAGDLLRILLAQED